MRTLILLFIALALASNVSATPQPNKTEALETIWDILNVLFDGGKIAVGYATGNPAMVTSGMTDLALDAAAMCIPGVPAGWSKFGAFAVKQGAKQSTKTYTKSMSKSWMKHCLAEHGSATTVLRKGKFFFNNTDDLAKMVVKAKNRIAQGHANVQFNAPTGAFHYLVDMGETVGEYYYKKGKYKPTNVVSVIISVNCKDGNFGSFAPVVAKSINKEIRGFLNI